MKSRIMNWFKGHRVLRTLLPGAVALLLVLALVVPAVLADAPSYLDVEGTYTVSGTISAKYLDRTRHPAIGWGTLTITTQSSPVISAATLTWMGEDIALTGLVGSGSKPLISLKGSGSGGTEVSIYGTVSSKAGVATTISGRIQGFITSDGEKWDDSADGTAAAYAGANSYGGYGYCALLTAGTLTNPEAVIFHGPANSFKLSQMDTLAAGRNSLSFYFNLQDTKGPGPQIMLRFAPAGSTDMDYYTSASGHVDITIMPYQAPYIGDGTWKQYTVTGDSAICGYYGNDPTDYTSFDGGFAGENYTLAEIEAAINAEAAMTAGGDNASNWVLTMVDVELWEGGARTCYVDNVQIGKFTYTLEPAQFSGSFKARKSS